MHVETEREEGLYNLYFHSCPNYKANKVVADFSVRLPNSSVTLCNLRILCISNFQMQITEMNNRNYLSAGEMPLPALYFMMAMLFMLSGCFWVFILRNSK